MNGRLYRFEPIRQQVGDLLPAGRAWPSIGFAMILPGAVRIGAIDGAEDRTFKRGRCKYRVAAQGVETGVEPTGDMRKRGA